MAMILNGQVGWFSGTPYTPPASTLWTNIYAVYNADSVGSSSLKTSLYAAYNGESNANDSFGSNNGTAVGGLTYTAGKIGNAFQFNGTNAYVSLPNSSGEFNFTGDFTISIWVNVSLATKTQIFFGNYVNGGTYGYGYTFTIVNSRISLELRNGNVASVYATPTSSITANTWTNITAVRKVGQDTKIYINGVLSSGNYTLGNNTIAPTYTASNACRIGYALVGASSLYSDCKQDATTIWNRELSASEITELYNSGNGSQYITTDFYKPTTNDALNTYNGTAQGGLTYGVGKVGTAFQFNGTNSFINLPTSSLQLTTFSINFWIFNPAPQTTTIAANFGNDGQNKGWYFGLITTNGHGIRFVAFNNNVNIIGLNATATSSGGYTNRWSMGTITVNGTSVKMYLDGSLVSSGTMSNTINYTTTTYPLIGGYRVNNGGVSAILANNTRLDAFNVWDKELSATEITELYNSGNGKQYPN